jgi:uncharacterized membrane protein
MNGEVIALGLIFLIIFVVGGLLWCRIEQKFQSAQAQINEVRGLASLTEQDKALQAETVKAYGRRLRPSPRSGEMAVWTRVKTTKQKTVPRGQQKRRARERGVAK